MSSTLRSFALPVKGVSELTITGGTGTSGNPFTVYVDMTLNNAFTLDLTQFPATADSPGKISYILCDTRAGAPIQNAGKLVTLMFTGLDSSYSNRVYLTFTRNFGTQYNRTVGGLQSNNIFAGVAFPLMSNGTSFILLNSSSYD
jgi:hypothetical protein